MSNEAKVYSAAQVCCMGTSLEVILKSDHDLAIRKLEQENAPLESKLQAKIEQLERQLAKCKAEMQLNLDNSGVYLLEEKQAIFNEIFKSELDGK